MTMPRRVAQVLAEFRLEGEPAWAAPWPGGHINESWRVECRTGDGVATYLLQRLNATVFPDPARVMDNVVAVVRHCEKRLVELGVRDRSRRTLRLAPLRDGGWWHRDGDGACWRVFDFIPDARVRYWADEPEHAREAARAFGMFLQLMDGYAATPLAETIPGFHDTARRLRNLESAARDDPHGRAAAARVEIDACLAAADLAAVLPPLLERGGIPRRVAHNDAKIANVLLDADSGEALTVIDLDTVMPGTALYDFGDLVRSLASPTDEDERDLARVGVRPAFFEAIVRGFLGAAGEAITAAERERLVFAGRLITLEQAIRFLTDHLGGDRYYRVSRPGQNLDRARTQLALFRSLTERAGELEEIVRAVGA